MRRALLTLTLTAALLGCGGEDKLSPEEYRSELRAICKESDRLTAQVDEPTRATGDAIADYFRRLRDINGQTIKKVEELTPPDELKGPHQRALDANRQGRTRVDSVISQLESGADPKQVLAAARADLEASSAAAKKAAEDVGVPECGE